MKFNLFLGAAGEYQTLLQQVTLPYVDHDKCETLLRATRLGERFGLGESFNCAGGKFQSMFTMATRVVEFSNGGVQKKDLWPKINILKGNHCILRILGVPVCQKLGMILENKVVQKMKLEKNVLFTKKLSPKLTLLNE